MSVDPGNPPRDDNDDNGRDRGNDALDQLAGEYVLGTLSSARRTEVERRLVSEAALRERVLYWEGRLHPLTALMQPVDPVPATWSRIARTLGFAETPERKPTVKALENWWNSLRLWRGIAVGATACSVLLAALLGARIFAPPPAPRYVVVLATPQDKAPGWLVQASTSRALKLIPLNAQAAPPDRALQFWTKADSWSGPVSLGLVKAGETLDVALDRLPALEPNQLFEITLEPAAGSPLGRPTGPILYIGRAVRVY